jgi:N-acetylmuramoyl-L-alanine amidase
LSVAPFVGPLEAQAVTELKAVRFATHEDHGRVVLDLDGRVGYSLGTLSSPERLYLDLVDTRPGPALRGGRIAIDDALVRLIRVGQPEAAVTRVVLDLNEAAEPDVFWLDAPTRLVVDLRRRGTTPRPHRRWKSHRRSESGGAGGRCSRQ